MTRKIAIAVGLALGFQMLDVSAEFSGYYAIGGSTPGGTYTLNSGEVGPIARGNWSFGSEGRAVVTHHRDPAELSAGLARGFTLTGETGGTPANKGSFQIVQPTVSDDIYDLYTFTYNFGLPVADNKAWFVDAAGSHLLAGQGSSEFIATRGSSGDMWGFFVECGSPNSVALLQVQDWQPVPEPSAIAMALLTAVGGVAYMLRKHRVVKSA